MGRLEPNEVPNRVSQSPRVSVYMVAYQHADYVRQAVESVVTQKTDFPFEVCLGEDESNDGTREICKKLAEDYPEKIRLFLRSRADVIKIDGRTTGRYNSNMTRNACRAPYVAICECDDFWIDEHKLQRQYDLLEENPNVSICATRGIRRNTDKSHPDVVLPPSNVTTLDHDWFVAGKTGIFTATLMYRVADVNQTVICDPEILTGDWALMLAATENGKTCAVLPDIAAVYRNHGKGIWTGMDGSSRLSSRKRTLERYLVHATSANKKLAQESIDVLNLRIAYSKRKNKLSKLGFLARHLTAAPGRRLSCELFDSFRNRF